ncbi:hypothetical protein ACFFRR_003910 [Megaselia abdita]
MLVFKFTLVFALIAALQCFPTSIEEVDHELSGGFFEGDMELSDEEKKFLFSGRNGIADEKKRWPNATVYFKITEEFDDAHYNQIITGLRAIESVSCIRFLPATSKTTAYINVTAEATGCHSKVGYQKKVQGLNLQYDKLNKGCFKLGTIIHEFLHALGFHHQQSTHNRDEYVHIAFENIKDGKEGNFKLREDSLDFGVEYDYGSVLHYSSTAFSKNGNPTIIPLQNGQEIGQRIGMSNKDIHKLNMMYKCPVYV